MSFRTIPLISALMMLSSLAPIHAAENIPAHQQQAELVCALCQEHDGLDGDIFVIECEGRPLVTHMDCMQDWLAAGYLECPTCRQHFSSETLALVLNALVGDEIVFEDLQELIYDLQQDEEAARQLQDELDAQVRADRQEQIRQDEELARLLAGIVAAELGQMVQEPAVQAAQPQNNQQQQAAQDENDQDECSICMDELNNGDATRALPCAHNFHHRCITNWIATNSSCPLCRAPVNQQPAQGLFAQARAVLVN